MPHDTPRVSVILPAYNAARYIESAVRSVLDQTFTDFELIVIDDGSKDDTGVILEAIAAGDDRLKVVRRENRGLVATLNEMIDRSSAGLIARMDADDLCLPDRLAKQVAFMDAHPDVVLLGGAYWLIDGDGRRLTTIIPPADDTTLQESALVGKTPVCHPLAVYRKAAVQVVGGYRAETMLAEDLDLWLRLGEVGRIACLPDVLLEYRQHAGSISESKQAEQQGKLAEVVRQAYARRGLKRDLPPIKPWRAGTDDDSRYRQVLKYGWWAFNSGHAKTARVYGCSAVRLHPMRPAGWKLLACGWLKRPTRKAG